MINFPSRYKRAADSQSESAVIARIIYRFHHEFSVITSKELPIHAVNGEDDGKFKIKAV